MCRAVLGMSLAKRPDREEGAEAQAGCAGPVVSVVAAVGGCYGQVHRVKVTIH